ncbi:MAG: methyltransferase [Thermoproteota archaeon]|jgi:release factor glutamine methyltransferase|nr:methyltransferase [Thermoproteota archaeon]
MYTPSDDTFLLADCITAYSGSWALEIGVGSGILLSILENNFDYVAGSDIDLNALHYSKHRSPTVLLVCCDAASAFGNHKFDLIISNPPYLPNEEDDDRAHKTAIAQDKAVHGGRTGMETAIHFVNSALPVLSCNGRMLLVTSTMADSSSFDIVVEQNKLGKKIINTKRLFYETLSVIELRL